MLQNCSNFRFFTGKHFSVLKLFKLYLNNSKTYKLSLKPYKFSSNALKSYKCLTPTFIGFRLNSILLSLLHNKTMSFYGFGMTKPSSTVNKLMTLVMSKIN